MKKRWLIVLVSLIGIAALGAITLEESIEMAKSNNKNLLMVAEEVSMADAQYKDVRGSLLPQFSLQGQYGLSKTYLPDSATGALPSVSDMLVEGATDNEAIIAGTLDGIMGSLMPSSPKDEGSLSMQVKMDQVLFLGGKLINGIKAVARYRSIQKLNYQVQEQALILNTTELFYQVLLSEKAVEIQRDGLETARKHLARVELLSQEGQVSEFDVLRARLEVAKLEPEVLAAENGHSLALSAFKQLIGFEDENGEIELEGGFVMPSIAQMTLAEAQALGLENRTELELLDIATEIQRIKYNAERGNYLPDVALSASAALFTAADEFAIQKDDFGTQYSVGIGFRLPIFTGFSHTNKVSYAKHDLSKAKLQQRDTQELITLEIKQSYQKLEHALQNHAVQEQNIRLATRSLELAQIRFENQVGIQLEVFDAQIMLSAVRLQYYSAIYDVIVSERALTKAIGKNLIAEK